MTSHIMSMDPYNGSGMNGLDRRFSLPTGYRLLNDLSSLKRQGQRMRKDNLVTRGGAGVKVRHVPILLEVEEKNGEEEEEVEEKKELRRGTMMTAAPIMLQTNQHASQKTAPRPPRFSLPSPSVTESAKVQDVQNPHITCTTTPPSPFMHTILVNTSTFESFQVRCIG